MIIMIIIQEIRKAPTLWPNVPTKVTVVEGKKKKDYGEDDCGMQFAESQKTWTVERNGMECWRIRNICHYCCQYWYRPSYTQSDSHSRFLKTHTIFEQQAVNCFFEPSQPPGIISGSNSNNRTKWLINLIPTPNGL